MPIVWIILAIGLILIVAYVFLGIGTAAIGYMLLQGKSGGAPAYRPPSPSPPINGSKGWAFSYSPNMPALMADNGDGTFGFDFPSQDGVHYVTRGAAGSLTVGGAITMSFSITGDGTIVSSQDGGQAYVTLYMQRQGDNMTGSGQYQQHRYFGGSKPLSMGVDTTIVLPLTGDQWGDVFGKRGSDFPQQFASCIQNVSVIGFVFGNPSVGATGHGAHVVGGNAHFTLKSFTVQ